MRPDHPGEVSATVEHGRERREGPSGKGAGRKEMCGQGRGGGREVE